MRTLLRWLLVLLVFSLVALAAGVFWFRGWLTDGRGATELAARAEAALGREVRVEAVSLPGPFSLAVGAVALEAPGGPDFLTLKDLRLDLDWRASLAMAKPVFSAVTVGGGRVQLDRDAANRKAGAAPAGRPASPGRGEPAAPGGAGTPAPGARVGGPPVIARLVEVGPVEVFAAAEGREALFALRKLTSELGPTGSLVAEADGVTAGGGNWQADATGELAASPPAWRAHLVGAGVSLAGPVGVGAALAGLPPGVGATGSISLDVVYETGAKKTLKAKVLPSKVALRHPALPVPLEVPEGTFQVTPVSMDINVPLRLAGLKARVNGDWTPPEPTGALALDLAVERFGLAELLPLLPPDIRAQVEGRGQGDFLVEAEIRGTPRAPEVDAKIRPEGFRIAAQGALPEVRVEGPGLTVAGQTATIDVGLVAGELKGALAGTLTPLAADGSLEATLRSEAVPLATAARLGGAEPATWEALAGQVDLEVEYAGKPREPAADRLAHTTLRLEPRGVRYQPAGQDPVRVESDPWKIEKGALTPTKFAVTSPKGVLRGRAQGDPSRMTIDGTVSGLQVEGGPKPVELTGPVHLVWTPGAAEADVTLEGAGASLAVKGTLTPPGADGEADTTLVAKALPVGLMAAVAGVGGRWRGLVHAEGAYKGPLSGAVEERLKGLRLDLRPEGLSGSPEGFTGAVALASDRLRVQAGALAPSKVKLTAPQGVFEGTVSAGPADGVLLDGALSGLRPVPPGGGEPPVDLRLGGPLKLRLRPGKADLGPFTWTGSWVAAGGSHPVTIETGGGVFTAETQRLRGLKIRGPGVTVDGDAARDAAGDVALDLAVVVDAGAVPAPLPAGYQVGGKVLGTLAYQGPIEGVTKHGLALRPEGVTVRAPGAPPVRWKAGAVELSPGGADLAGVELALGEGEGVSVTAKGFVSRDSMKVQAEAPAAALAAWLALAGQAAPEGYDLAGSLGGRAFYQGPVPPTKADLERGLALRLQPRGVRVAPRPAGEATTVTLGDGDVVMKKGAIDLAQVKLDTAFGVVALRGSLDAFSGAAPKSLGFSAARLVPPQDWTPEGVQIAGGLGVSGKLIPRAKGGAEVIATVTGKGLAMTRGGAQLLSIPDGGLLVEGAMGEGVPGGRALAVRPDGLHVAFAALKTPITWASGELNLTGETAALKKVGIKLGTTTAVVVDGAITDALATQKFEGMRLGGLLHLADIGPAFGLDSSRQLIGDVTLKADILGSAKDFRVGGQMAAPQGVAVVFKSTTGGRDVPIPFTQLVVPFSFQGTNLALEDVDARIYGGRIHGDIRFGFHTTPFQMMQSWKIEGLQVLQFVQQSLGMPGGAAGTLSTDLEAVGTGADVTTMSFQGRTGSVKDFTLQGEVLGQYFELSKMLNPMEAAMAKKKPRFGDLLRGFVLEKAISKVDALAEYREHLRALLKDHSYPELRFQFGGPQGWIGWKRFWIEGNPGLFEGDFQVKLDTLDLQANLAAMSFRFKEDCRVTATDVRFGGKATAPTLEDKDFWKRMEKKCGP